MPGRRQDGKRLTQIGVVELWADKGWPAYKTFVFTSEAIENITAGWRARETYRILSADEFVEEFALAPPGKDFEIYSESRHKRKSDAGERDIRFVEAR